MTNKLAKSVAAVAALFISATASATVIDATASYEDSSSFVFHAVIPDTYVFGEGINQCGTSGLICTDVSITATLKKIDNFVLSDWLFR